MPAFAVWPGRIAAGVTTPEVIQLTDLLPTFVAAAGGKVDPAWHVDGINLLASWTGNAPFPEGTLFWEWCSEGSDQIVALKGQFKLIVTRGRKSELYDVVGIVAMRQARRRCANTRRPAPGRRWRAGAGRRPGGQIRAAFLRSAIVAVIVRPGFQGRKGVFHQIGVRPAAWLAHCEGIGVLAERSRRRSEDHRIDQSTADRLLRSAEQLIHQRSPFFEPVLQESQTCSQLAQAK